MSNQRIWAFFYAAAAFFAQNALQGIFPYGTPPLVLMTVIFYALAEGPRFGFILGLVAGFYLDLLGAGKMGPAMAALAFTGAFSGVTAGKIFRENLFIQIFLPGFGVFFLALARFISSPELFLDEGRLCWAAVFLWASKMAFAAILAPFYFQFLKKISGERGKKKRVRSGWEA